jgi:hypothetical protein
MPEWIIRRNNATIDRQEVIARRAVQHLGPLQGLDIAAILVEDFVATWLM